jgi:hypothetical protein
MQVSIIIKLPDSKHINLKSIIKIKIKGMNTLLTFSANDSILCTKGCTLAFLIFIQKAVCSQLIVFTGTA